LRKNRTNIFLHPKRSQLTTAGNVALQAQSFVYLEVDDKGNRPQ